MESCQKTMEEQVDIHQTRQRLPNPKDPRVLVLTNCLIYGAFYYPLSQSFIDQILAKTSKPHIDSLTHALSHVFDCMQKEIIYGPSSSHIPPSEIPHANKLDTALAENQKIQGEFTHEDFLKGNNELGLENIVGDRSHELSWYCCLRMLSQESVQQYAGFNSKFEKELQIDGQSWLQSTPFSYMFPFLNYVLHKITDSQQLEEKTEVQLRLIWARLSFLHNKTLRNPVGELSKRVLGNYRRVIKITQKQASREEYIQLLLQYSFCLLFYYKYRECEEVLRHCEKILKMKLEFTGKMGRRTKYQSFDTPQMVMNIKEGYKEQPQQDQEEVEEDEKIDLIPAKELVHSIKQRAQAPEVAIDNAGYEQDSILLEAPALAEGQAGHEEGLAEVTEHHLLVSLAILYYDWRSSPHDQMLFQNMSASILRLLSFNTPTSFSYRFSLLLLRSLSEFSRIKHTERALDQLQKLKLSYNGRAEKDVSNLYSTPYQSHLGYVIVLADRYMEMGLSMSAVELFQKAGMYEECIDALISRNYKERALELIDKQMENKAINPRMLCMLGDAKNDSKYYEEAWQLSKGTNARSMRALGWHHYNKKDVLKAAECFQKATKASYYHPQTWFTLGCCHMQNKNFDQALKAFSQTISIDDTQGQAWGNMASCFMYLKKPREAFSTLEQAVKYSERSWKLWANLLSVSLVIKRFYKYIEAFERIVKLNQSQILDEEKYMKIVQIMSYKNESDERRRIIYSMKNRIDRLYEFLKEKIGENYLVWRSYTLYQIQILEYIQVMQVHYHNLHVSGKIDPNDLLQGYQTLESTALISKASEAVTKRAIVESKQAELNMRMKVGWHQSKSQAEKVKTTLEQYVKIYRQYSERKDKDDFRLFVDGVCQKISACTEEQYSIELAWLG